MDSHYNKNNGSQKKPPPTRHRPDDDEDEGKKEAVPATKTPSRTNTRVISDAQAKLRGSRPSSTSKEGGASNIRFQPKRSMPSHLRSSTASGSSNGTGTGTDNSNSNTTKLRTLQEDVSAKASGRATTASAKRRPVVLPSSIGSQSPSSIESNLTSITRLNRMEADIAAKERARNARGFVSAKAKPKTVTMTSPSKSVETTNTVRRLDRMEAEIAAKTKAKASRASASLKNRSGSASDNDSTKAKALTKRLQKSVVASNTPASSSKNKGGLPPPLEDDKKKFTTMGKGDMVFVGASAAGMSDVKKQKSSSKHQNYLNGGSNQRSDINLTTNMTLPSGDADHDSSDFDFIDESHDHGGNNRLVVAVAVHEDENENVFIPSAVKYDPDAKLPVYKNQRIRVYSILSCTLLIIIATCSIVVLSVIEEDKLNAANKIPTESPTCSRCTMDFIEKLQLEVGVQKLEDPTSPEYKAMQWIIHEDVRELLPTDKSFVQRFFMASFYFATHELGDWRSCNRQNLDPSANETDDCTLGKVTDITPDLSYTGFDAYRWLGGEHECLWAGVGCDKSYRIRTIDLHGQGIQGTLPTILERLPDIQTISLQLNEFTGTLPSEFGRMRHLIQVELHENKFTGTFPVSWTSARNLQLLNIASNRLTGQLPMELGQFRNIKGIFLFKNQFSGSLPPEIATSKSLAFLRFHKNAFTGTIPSEFGDMQLSELWLHGNENLTGTIPTELGKLSHYMSDFRLAQTSLEGTLPEFLFNMQQIWRFDVKDCNLSGTISSEFARIGNLQVLQLDNNNFTGEIPTELGSLTNLDVLGLSGNNLTGSIPSSICDLQTNYNILTILTADCLKGPDDQTIANACECCQTCCNAEECVVSP